ncbi:copper resistance protein CopC [Modestobacter sp. I12A-02628]|uniref:Copper resistance protein CopC n=1 Tax=Goekera deserti TaxID=2497753 RepID=A0A7K3WC85_9ACTN|nr:copper resistance CopC family protein [Goekera deserti]MPQ98408.1 copper resistance protein CopC [Goekera deserti]NDI48235.1 copper resistance protein CopC [Goekera deserti]NEL53984.1 copper resistance protein CopC [Goekera deserti]
MRRLVALPLLLLALLGLAGAVDVGTARPASAHAVLADTTPAADARLDVAPTIVELRFSEAVSLGAGYARVLAAGGDRVDTGSAAVAGDVLTVPLRTGLSEGSYVVTWRVVSADSHPVSGAYAFVVGDAELVPADAAASGSGTDAAVAVALPAARTLGYAGLAAGIGVPVLLALCWPGGWALARLRRLATAGAAGVAVAALASFLLQGPYAAGAGLGSLLDPALLDSTASSAYGATLLLRALLALMLAALLATVRLPPGRPALVGGAVLATGLVLTTAAVGHPVAGAGTGLAVAAAVVHVAAMVVWLGGLAGLLVALLRPGVPVAELREALPRFSRLAFGAVSALVVSGVVQSVREVGSLGALVSTSYGWLLVAKLALVAVVLAAAGVSRVWVQQHVGALAGRRVVGHVTAHAFAATPGPQERVDAAELDTAPFRRSVLVEAAVAAVVLAVSAVLVGTAPAADAAGRPVDVTLPLQSSAGSTGNGSVGLTLDPASPGPTAMHIYLLDESGRLVQPRDIAVDLREPAQQIGPLAAELEPSGPGHWTGVDVAFPTAGNWTVTVTVRLDQFTAVTASTVVAVR